MNLRVLRNAAFGLSIAFVASAAPAPSPPYLNLDFETSTRGLLWSWNVGASGYDYAVDTASFQSGSQSARIRYVNAPASTLGVVSQQFPIELVRGKHVKFSGWMKTDSVSDSAGFWWRVDGAKDSLSLDNAPDNGGTGATGWTLYQFERDISAGAVAIYFGAFLSGQGTAWFDNIQIEIDGVPFIDGPAPVIGEPTADQLTWVSANAIPIVSADPNQPYLDLMPLKKVIGDAHVVGLGEATHGTREFFQMKHRIIDFLAKEMGFTIFSIEANMPEAYRMNDYVLNGNGDPKELLKGMYFWTWNTQEVLDMVQWMREFNASGLGRIQFTGFDMQVPKLAELNVREFLGNADPVYRDQVTSIYNNLNQPQGFGVAGATLPKPAPAGKRLRYTGYIKTEGVTLGYAGLWWRCDGPSGPLVLDNMSTRGATGTKDWQQFEIDMSIPPTTTSISFGVLHPGAGTAWFDSLAIELDGVPYSTNGAIDLDFESPTPVGFGVGGAGYQVQLDATVAHTGRQSLRSTYIGSSNSPSAAAVAGIVIHMEASRDAYISQGFTPVEVDWAIQNARIVAQATALTSDSSVRDPAMATNIQWIIDHSPPGSKIVLWAHDFHVSRDSSAMGSYLDTRYGKDYVVLGFGFNDGTYNAVGPDGLKPYTASTSFPGSYEYVFHQTGIPQFILDLRLASPDDPASSWLLDPMQFRIIGAVPYDGFSLTRLAHNYDALIYFEHSSPSTLLPF